MTPLKHPYRQFKASRIVFLGGEVTDIQVDYQKFNETGLKAVEDPEKPLKGTDFAATAENITSKLHLDDDLANVSPEEQALRDQIAAHIDSEVLEINHNYQLRLMEVGEGTKEAKEAKAALDEAMRQFLFQVEMHALEQSLPQEKEGQLSEGSRNAMKAMIDSQTGVTGLAEFMMTGGDYKNSLKKVFEPPLPKNPEDFKDRFSQAFNEQVLKKAIQQAVSLGEIKEFGDDRAYFMTQIENSVQKAREQGEISLALTSGEKLGTKMSGELAQTLAQRFRVVKNEENPAKGYVVDLKEGNVYGIQAFEEKELPFLCKRDMGSREALKKEQRELKRERKERERAAAELTGELGERLTKGRLFKNDKVDTVKDLANNKTLEDVLARANKIQEQIEERNLVSKASDLTEGKGREAIDETEKDILGQKAPESAGQPASTTDNPPADGTDGKQAETGKSDPKAKAEAVKESVSKKLEGMDLAKAVGQFISMLKEMFDKGGWQNFDIDLVKNGINSLERGEDPNVMLSTATSAFGEVLKTKKVDDISDLLAIHADPHGKEANLAFNDMNQVLKEDSVVNDAQKARFGKEGEYRFGAKEAVRVHVQSALGADNVRDIKKEADGSSTMMVDLKGRSYKVTLKVESGNTIASVTEEVMNGKTNQLDKVTRLDSIVLEPGDLTKLGEALAGIPAQTPEPAPAQTDPKKAKPKPKTKSDEGNPEAKPQ